MFNYEKRLEYPVHITRTDPKAAMVIISQYGGLYSASLCGWCKIYLCILHLILAYAIMPVGKTME